MTGSRNGSAPAGLLPLTQHWSLIALAVVTLTLSQSACYGFNLDFTNKPGTGTETVSGDWIRIYFTNPHYPDDSADHYGGIDEELASVIGLAEDSVDMVAYELDLRTVVNALIDAHQDGVRVRVIVESDNLEKEENEELANELRRAGISIVEDERSRGLMHDKYVVIDERWVWTGLPFRS